MGIFDESERGGTKVSEARSRVRKTRPSWPLPARLLVGAMFVLNILLAAFLVRTEIKRPGAPAASTPPAPDRPKAATPQLNAPPDQGSSLDQGSGRGLKTLPVESKPTRFSSTHTQMAKRTVTKALRASKTPRAVFSVPMPRAVIHPPQEPLGRTPAPVRNPASSSSASANVAPPGRAASFNMPGAAVPSNPGTIPRRPLRQLSPRRRSSMASLWREPGRAQRPKWPRLSFRLWKRDW